MTHPIPAEALDERHAFVGTAGSGKTYSAGTAVERVLRSKGRVIVVDPLGVWWGLRLTLDGETPSPFKVVIFGGAHGDLPINEHAGALIGETVAGMAESCILDLSGIGTKAGERRFMLAFLTALYRKTTGEPVHIVFDEADMFAPQRLLDKEGEAAKLLGMMETIVRRGRVKGFIPWLITQRPAVLSKDVLSQADGLVAFKLTSSQDRDAIGAWIEGQADKEQWKTIYASLAGMQVGQGVVWIPGRSVLTTAQFPPKATYDSSRTPKRGEKQRAATLKPIDLGALKERLSTVEAEFKANDPKALRAEIAALKRQIASAPVEKINTPDPDAEARGYDRGFADGSDKILRAVASLAGDLSQSIERAEEACAGTKRLLSSFAGFTASQADELKRRPVARPAPQPAAKREPPLQPAKTGSDLSPALQRVINAIGWWRKIGFEPIERARASVVAGYSPKASTFGVYIAELVKLGLVESSPGKVALTNAGQALAEVPFGTTREELRDVARGLLSPQEAKIFDVVYEAYPDEVHRREIAESVGLSPEASTAGVYIAGVAAYGMIEAASRGHVRAADWLFP